MYEVVVLLKIYNQQCIRWQLIIELIDRKHTVIVSILAVVSEFMLDVWYTESKTRK